MSILSCSVETDVTLHLGTGATELVLSAECPGDFTDEQPWGLWWNRLELPPFRLRYEWAPPSMVVPGQTLLAVTEDRAAIAGRLVVVGRDPAGVAAGKAAVRTALARFRSTVAIRHGAYELGSWAAMPTLPVWDDLLTPHRLASFTAGASFLIPVQPVGAP